MSKFYIVKITDDATYLSYGDKPPETDEDWIINDFIFEESEIQMFQSI